MDPEALGQGDPNGTDQGQPVEQPQGQQQSDTVNINPAWNDVLGLIPQTLHSQITPKFQEWDKNYQNSIQKVHSQYEPWKPFIDGGIDPENVNFSLGLMNAISENPQEVVNAIQTWMKEEGVDPGQQSEQQGQFDQTPQYDPNDITSHPKFVEMEEALQTMAQIMLQQRETEQSAQQDQELEDELGRLKQEHGDFDENYVISICANSDGEISLEDAIQMDQERTQSILSGRRQPGPPVLGSGGAFPNSTPDPRKLGSTDTRNLVAQMLQQAKGQ